MHWVQVIFILLFLAAAIYTVIPDLFLHRLGIGSCKKLNSPAVALTFDDGPNPGITPQILEILARYNVTATFFVIGAKAIRYPELINLILSQGHNIGLHSQYHRYAWFMSPLATWREWEECLATVEHISGQRIEWVRPPWGTFNLVTWFWIKMHNKKAVLWSIDGHDWLARRKPEQITDRIIKQIKIGSIIVLHDDGGEEGAPQNTLHALEPLIQKIRDEQKLPLADYISLK